MYLLDTNILSELRKGSRCDPRLRVWIDPLSAEELFISVLVLGEIRKGIELLSIRDPRSAMHLDQWLRNLEQVYADRILPVTMVVAEEWGRMNAQRPLSAVDSLMAATAKVHRLVLVTRNITDLRDVGVRLLNPFEEG